MKKKIFTLLFAITALVYSERAAATVDSVMVQNISFTPGTVTAQVGDTIRWIWVNGTHTTSSVTTPGGAMTWDNPINSSNPSFSYKITMGGTYTYQCNVHGAVMSGIIIAATTGLNNVEQDEAITVSPNPARNELKLHMNKAATVDLLDATGKLVRHLQPTATTATDMYFNVSDIAAGIYILNIKTANEMVMRKVIIAK